MTTIEFNEKYRDYLGKGYYGMAIPTPEVIEAVDRQFQEWIKLPNFEYHQIKLKFGKARVYAEAEGTILETYKLEDEINEIVKEVDSKRPKI